jgi:acyl-CoA synthetase (AMP-forming)/AMP-acid ligase II
MLQGLMMNTPLVITSIMRFAECNFPGSRIVSVSDGGTRTCSYAETFRRTRQLAHGLRDLGIRPGDRVATLAWNDHRHFEIYYAASCYGAVCHTVNPRLFPDQIAYIIDHAEDAWIFADPMFAPLLAAIWPRLRSPRGVTFLTDSQGMPDTPIPAASDYETLLTGKPDRFEWPELDERTASALCYTSGTTGLPKGVLYDHRSTLIHAYAACMPDVISLRNRDSVLAVVPMFHANAWSLPYACPMVGADLVLPGPRMGDPEVLADLIDEFGVTVTLGVPTVWLGLLAYLRKSGRRIESLERMVVGGAACPESLMKAFREEYGVEVHHSWGMTEMSPLGVLNSPTKESGVLPPGDKDAQRLKQGRGVFGVEMRIVDESGEELPWDGSTSGSLQVRGPWVCGAYYRPEEPDPAHRSDGWFDTGDVATIDEMGFMQITDRAKDVIKSGGEWISSIELENVAMSHEGVAEAAVIGVPHPRWGERPLLIVVPSESQPPDPAGLLEWMRGKVVSWWLPDDVIFVEEIPHTATGKIAKTELRRLYGNHRLPERASEG